MRYAPPPAVEQSLAPRPSFQEIRRDVGNQQWNRYIVRVRDEMVAERFSDSVVASVGGRAIHNYRYVLRGFTARLPEDAVARLRESRSVLSVEKDQISFPTGRFVASMLPTATQSWGLDRIDDRTGLDGDFSPLQGGSGVEVWILDTGVDSLHSEFSGRIGTKWATYTYPLDPFVDCTPHGTGVASVAAGSTFGVAKDATIYSVQVGNCLSTPISGAAFTSDIIAGLDFVRQWAKPPAIANLSYSPGHSSSLDAAANSLYFSGVPLVVSAGNDGENACDHSPHRIGLHILVVAASTSSDQKASFSAFGPCVDLFAPGSVVPLAWTPAPNGTSFASGTSFAAPYAVGVLALIMDGNGVTAPWTANEIIVGSATSGALSSIGLGSPNLLLYSPHIWAIVSGPKVITSSGSYTWSAQGYGGDGTYSFSWQVSFDEGSSWATVGNGSSYSRYIGATHADFSVRVLVTSIGEQIPSRPKDVSVVICGGLIC